MSFIFFFVFLIILLVNAEQPENVPKIIEEDHYIHRFYWIFRSICFFFLFLFLFSSVIMKIAIVALFVLYVNYMYLPYMFTLLSLLPDINNRYFQILIQCSIFVILVFIAHSSYIQSKTLNKIERLLFLKTKKEQ